MICRLLFSGINCSCSPLKMFPVEQVLEELLWEALWLHMCVSEILQMRGPHRELFCFLMMHESGDGEALVCSRFGVWLCANFGSRGY